MKKLETVLKEQRVFSQIAECSITGTVLTEDELLVSESGIVMEGESGTIILPLLRAPEFIKELQAITHEMSGMVQRTTTVRRHTVGAFEVAEHDRKIPLGRKDIAAGGLKGVAHCAVEPVDEKHTKTGSDRKRRRNFTATEVREIRKLRKGGATVAELCHAYNAKDNNMRNIVTGKTYPKIK